MVELLSQKPAFPAFSVATGFQMEKFEETTHHFWHAAYQAGLYSHDLAARLQERTTRKILRESFQMTQADLLAVHISIFLGCLAKATLIAGAEKISSSSLFACAQAVQAAAKAAHGSVVLQSAARDVVAPRLRPRAHPWKQTLLCGVGAVVFSGYALMSAAPDLFPIEAGRAFIGGGLAVWGGFVGTSRLLPARNRIEDALPKKGSYLYAYRNYLRTLSDTGALGPVPQALIIAPMP